MDQTFNNKTIYKTNESIVFCRTKDEFGFLSNMSGGFPINCNKWYFPTSEHLYQALKLGNNSELQYEITKIKSPIAAKFRVYQSKDLWVENWFEKNILASELTIYIKLLQNIQFRKKLIDLPANKPIVELSFKDNFWGTNYLENKQFLIGNNVTGKNIMLIRNNLKDEESYKEYLRKVISNCNFKINNWLIKL